MAAAQPYGHLAAWYDHLNHSREGFDRARTRILGKLLSGVESACDLCCGTGATAVALASGGIRMVAVDRSPGMCRLARARARRAGVDVRIVQNDMRSFRLSEPVDLVICEFDSLNHVPRRSDLRTVLRSVNRALRPGGYFAFDVNNRAAFERIWSRTWFVDTEEVAMIMEGEHRPGTDRARLAVNLFVRSGRIWKRYRDYVEEVCWSADEIRLALFACGFGRIRSWDAARFFSDGLTQRGNRTFWLVRKA